MLATLSLITNSLYVFVAYGQVSTDSIKTRSDRENNIKILFSTIPAQPTIGTPSALRFTVQNLQTAKPVANLLANVVIVGGTSNQGSYQVITKITSSQTHDVASLASFTVIVPATQPALNPFGGNYITWIGILITSAVGVASFLILKNKNKNTAHKD
jgi:hypothetical protein